MTELLQHVRCFLGASENIFTIISVAFVGGTISLFVFFGNVTDHHTRS